MGVSRQTMLFCFLAVWIRLSNNESAGSARCQIMLTSVRVELSEPLVRVVCQDTNHSTLVASCGSHVWYERIVGLCSNLELNSGLAFTDQLLPSSTVFLKLVKSGQVLDSAKVIIITSEHLFHYRISVWGHHDTRFILKITRECAQSPGIVSMATEYEDPRPFLEKFSKGKLLHLNNTNSQSPFSAIDSAHDFLAREKTLHVRENSRYNIFEKATLNDNTRSEFNNRNSIKTQTNRTTQAKMYGSRLSKLDSDKESASLEHLTENTENLLTAVPERSDTSKLQWMYRKKISVNNKIKLPANLHPEVEVRKSSNLNNIQEPNERDVHDIPVIFKATEEHHRNLYIHESDGEHNGSNYLSQRSERHNKPPISRDFYPETFSGQAESSDQLSFLGDEDFISEDRSPEKISQSVGHGKLSSLIQRSSRTYLTPTYDPKMRIFQKISPHNKTKLILDKSSTWTSWSSFLIEDASHIDSLSRTRKRNAEIEDSFINMDLELNTSSSVSVLQDSNTAGISSSKLQSSTVEISPSKVTASISEISSSKLQSSTVEISPSKITASISEISSSKLQSSTVEVSSSKLQSSTVEISPSEVMASISEISSSKLQSSTVEISPSKITASISEISSSKLQSSTVEVSSSKLQSSTVEISPSEVMASISEISSSKLQSSTVEVSSSKLQSSTVEVSSSKLKLSTVEVSSSKLQSSTVEISPSEVTASISEISSSKLQSSAVEVSSSKLQSSIVEISSSKLQSSTVEISSSKLQSSTVDISSSKLQSSTVEISSSKLQSSTVEISPSEVTASASDISSSKLQSSTLETSSSKLQSSTLKMSTSDLQSSTVEMSSLKVQSRTVDASLSKSHSSVLEASPLHPNTIDNSPSKLQSNSVETSPSTLYSITVEIPPSKLQFSTLEISPSKLQSRAAETSSSKLHSNINSLSTAEHAGSTRLLFSSLYSSTDFHTVLTDLPDSSIYTGELYPVSSSAGYSTYNKDLQNMHSSSSVKGSSTILFASLATSTVTLGFADLGISIRSQNTDDSFIQTTSLPTFMNSVNTPITHSRSVYTPVTHSGYTQTVLSSVFSTSTVLTSSSIITPSFSVSSVSSTSPRTTYNDMAASVIHYVQVYSTVIKTLHLTDIPPSVRTRAHTATIVDILPSQSTFLPRPSQSPPSTVSPQTSRGDQQGLEDDSFWPAVAALVIGIPAVIVLGIAVTVIYRKRLARPAQVAHLGIVSASLHR